jgi:hypothetical protein
VVKDDNETFVRHYEFQKNYRQAIHLDIPDDENNFYIIKRIDELCIFNNGSKIDDNYINLIEKVKRSRLNSQTDDDSNDGNDISEKINMVQYPVYGSSDDKKMDNYNRENFNIIINKKKPHICLTNHKLYLDDNYFTVHMKDDNDMKDDNELLHKYIGYYLINHIDDIYVHHSRGVYVRQFDLNELKNLKIPIPVNENHILKTVNDCDMFYNYIIKLNSEILDNQNMIEFWSNIDINQISNVEINKLKNEIDKNIKDNIFSRKNLKKMKMIVYNEFLQQPLEENL